MYIAFSSYLRISYFPSFPCPNSWIQYTLRRVETALHVTHIAVGTKHLVARDSGTFISIAETGQHAAQRIGQVEAGRIRAAVQTAQYSACQRIVVQVAGVAAIGGVGVLLQPEGVHTHLGA